MKTEPKGVSARQAVDSLRGYAYQIMAATLAWLEIKDDSRLYLEVAEDYATLTSQALQAVQVKDTKGSASVTLNSEGVRKAVEAFVEITERNPDIRVELHFLTTSEIAQERPSFDLPDKMTGLEYWRKVAQGAPVGPLRPFLESSKFSQSVRCFSRSRKDDDLRRELISRIHWICGKPSLSDLRKELEDRLVVVGREQFNLPSQDSVGLADPLICHVMEKSVSKNNQNRVLTRADLCTQIDRVSRVSLQKSTMEAITRGLSNLIDGLGSGGTSEALLLASNSRWLIDSSALHKPHGTIRRLHVESLLTDALDRCGMVVFAGASGLGKTLNARSAIQARAGDYTVVDFRNATVDEALHRLDLLLGRVGGLTSSALILEDLNCLADQWVALSLGRVVEATSRRYVSVVITCYQKPSLKTLNAIGGGRSCLIDCPYFTEEETCSLVRANGGDPAKWGRLAYVVGAGGHPQLTHAFVVGVATRGWKAGDLAQVIKRGLSSDDIQETRSDARRGLVAALSKGARSLLYRLSLTSDRFSRSLALAISEIEPPVRNAGECLDELVGPWVEAVDGRLLRVSPLASQFGQEMLSPDEQECIHGNFAVRILSNHLKRGGAIDPSDVNTILIHAISGRSPHCLVSIAQSVLAADNRTLGTLSEQLIFRFFRTDAPIYPGAPFVSALLRAVQFRLMAGEAERSGVTAVASALFHEIDAISDADVRRGPEGIALSVVLSTVGVGGCLDNWISLIVRFKKVVRTDEVLRGLVLRMMESGEVVGANPIATLFTVGIAGVDSVGRLERIIDDLGNLNDVERAEILEPVYEENSNYYEIINSAWTLEQRNREFDAKDAVVRYERMAKKTVKWTIREVSLQCSVAQAVLIDEYINNKDGALAVLDEAVSRMGGDAILHRGIAKIRWRHGEYRDALAIFDGLVYREYGESAVERAFTFRMAAVCAAHCGEWSSAEKWFSDAESAARASRGENMDVMAIGLGADAAVAAARNKNPESALQRLKGAVEALAEVDGAASLRAAYCHHMVRAAALWVKCRFENAGTRGSNEPVKFDPGACSAADPSEAVRELPLRHLDVAWYVLAMAEVASGVDIGIAATLDDRLELDPIPLMECSLRRELIRVDIERLDSSGFATHFKEYVEYNVFYLKEKERIQARFDACDPERGRVPTIDQVAPQDPVAIRVSSEAIIAFIIFAAMQERRDSVRDLEKEMDGRFEQEFPGRVLFDMSNGASDVVGELEREVTVNAHRVIHNEYVGPREQWLAGLRFFEWTNQSTFFMDVLTWGLAAWMRSRWTKIVDKETFRLSAPRRTVPPIRMILEAGENDTSFVARMLLAGAEAVGILLGVDYRKQLEGLADKGGTA